MSRLNLKPARPGRPKTTDATNSAEGRARSPRPASATKQVAPRHKRGGTAPQTRGQASGQPVRTRQPLQHAPSRSGLQGTHQDNRLGNTPGNLQAGALQAPAHTTAPPAARPNGSEGERLNKYLAAQGSCSRREADDWISRGWVHINGQPAQMGQRVLPGDQVEVKKAATRQQQDQVTILLHKPVGYVSGQAEKGYQPAVVLIDERSHWAEDTLPRRFERKQLRGLAVAGRLDIDSVGLLILTQDGRIARQLIGEDSEISKEYLVRVRYGSIDRNVQSAFPADKLQLLRHGLSLDGKALKPAEVSWQNPEQLRFVLREGKHRQIRRMCELVGLSVTGLKRIRVGQITLGRLPAGQWRYLRPDESFN